MLKVMLIAALALAVPSLAFAKDATSTLQVQGWHCEGCSSATENALKKVPGVRSVKTDLKTGTAVVTFDDSKASLPQLEKAVEALGYKVAK